MICLKKNVCLAVDIMCSVICIEVLMLNLDDVIESAFLMMCKLSISAY